MLIEKHVCAERVVDARRYIALRAPFIHVRIARPGACIDTIFKGLNFFVHHKNEHFCL